MLFNITDILYFILNSAYSLWKNINLGKALYTVIALTKLIFLAYCLLLLTRLLILKPASWGNFMLDAGIYRGSVILLGAAVGCRRLGLGFLLRAQGRSLASHHLGVCAVGLGPELSAWALYFVLRLRTYCHRCTTGCTTGY